MRGGKYMGPRTGLPAAARQRRTAQPRLATRAARRRPKQPIATPSLLRLGVAGRLPGLDLPAAAGLAPAEALSLDMPARESFDSAARPSAQLKPVKQQVEGVGKAGWVRRQRSLHRPGWTLRVLNSCLPTPDTAGIRGCASGDGGGNSQPHSRAGGSGGEGGAPVNQGCCLTSSPPACVPRRCRGSWTGRRRQDGTLHPSTGG